MGVGFTRLAFVVGTAAIGAAAGLVRLGPMLVPVPDLPVPEMQSVGVTAKVVSTLEGTIAAHRNGRVLRARLAPAEAVSAGDPLIEFEDLPLLASIAELEREIAELREGVARAAPARPSSQDVFRESGLQLRLAALRQLENSYETAQREFERWRTLYEEGLVARVEYEREAADFSELGRRLDQARAAASHANEEPASPAEIATPPALRRSEGLLERLSRLSGTFVVRSPWDGIVREIHVQEGEVPDRGAPLVTVSRAAFRRLEADVGTDFVIVAVRSACGIPGPFAFSLQDRVFSLAPPPSEARLGEECRVVLLTRPRQE